MLSFSSHARFVAGCVEGLGQPCWAIGVSAADADTLVRAHELQSLVQAWLPADLTNNVPATRSVKPNNNAQAALHIFIELVQRLHAVAGLSCVQLGLLKPLARAQRPYLMLLPTLAAVATQSLKMVVALQRAFNVSEDGRDAAAEQLQIQLRAVRNAVPAGANLPHLLRHAWRLDIPTLQVSASLFQFGQGAHSHWLDSTFTETTSRSSAQLARDKLRTAQLLGQQGLPVPRQRSVADADAAVAAARELGGLVVVKPANLDGGLGVWTALGTEAAVREAFSGARMHSSRVLLEDHLPGRDHRLVVFQGDLLIAVERVPASVVGDGASPVAALVATANADPRRSAARGAPLKPLLLDAEALELLDAQRLTPASVPSQGQRIRLRRTANVATGGMPVDVTQHIHPDNRALAIAAAQALRLDLAGIDLLCPDITRSWREVGGGICEVNAQPNIGVLTADHLFEIVLRRLLPRGGRIPVVVVAGSPPPTGEEEGLASRISAALARRGHHVGLADRRGIHVNGGTMSSLLRTDFQRCRALLLNRAVSCIVAEANDPELLDSGLPLDRIDVLVADRRATHADAEGRDLMRLLLAGQVSTLLSAEQVCLAHASAFGARCAIRAATSDDQVVPLAVALIGERMAALWAAMPAAEP